MKNRILILLVMLLTLFIWSCDEEPPVGPEVSPQEEVTLEKVSIGTVTPILSLKHGNSPEGITFDKQGNMFISNTRGVNRSINEILKVNLDGSYSKYARLPGSGHAVGLVTDRKGNVYVAFGTNDRKTNGVYRIGHDGIPLRLKGSEKMLKPNALTFDWFGNLYCTDSDGYAVWKYKNKIFIKWLEDPLLVGGMVPGGTPFPLPGANGIAFFPPNKLYVANTAQNSISRIIIGINGKVASIELVKQDFLLMNVDGLAVDINENIYGVLPPSTLSGIGAPPLPPLVKLNPNTKVVTPIALPADANNFNTPTSLAFGTRGISNRLSVFIANAALQYGQSMDPWANPGVAKVFIGSFGLPAR